MNDASPESDLIPSSTPNAGDTPAGPPGARALAPDLARGVMLLLIAVANVPWYLWGSVPADTTVHPAGDTGADLLATLVTLVTIDGRVYPMFAFLFGYGMVQFARSRERRGLEERVVRRMLRRRHWAMLAIGGAHAALLWFGDVVAAYGFAGLVLVWLFFRRRTTTLLVWAGLGIAVLLAWTGLSVWGGLALESAGASGGASPAEAEMTGSAIWTGSTAVNGIPDYLASIPQRLGAWAPVTLFQGVFLPIVPVAILLGWAAARHEVLEHPQRHRRLLTVTAIVGLSIGWLGGAYAAAGYLGLLGWSELTWWVVMAVAMVTGLPCGIGYVAVFGLLADRLGGRIPVRARPLVAVGRRSLSCYLAQSVLFAPLLCAWGLGLGGRIGSAAAFALGVLVWLVTLVLAAWLERTGRLGPAETVLRRLTYGRLDAAPRPARVS